MNIGAFPATPITPTHRGQPTPPSHITATNLTRLLSRLDQRLGFSSHNDASQRPPSSLERAKIAANLEYARSILLTLEKEAETIRNLSQRQNTLAKLGQQKQAVRRLNEKLQISAHDAGEEEDDDTDNEMRALDSDDEELSSNSLVVSLSTASPAYSLENPGGHLERVYPSSIDSSNVRNRFPTQQESRTALFNNRGSGEESTEFTEKRLDLQRVEQEDITADMLALAQALKQNSLRFGEELEKEKGLLNLATEGLDKNMMGIEGAGRKMGQLRRDENVGWLWSILYPIVIVGLAFFTLFILFFAPKLRWW